MVLSMMWGQLLMLCMHLQRGKCSQHTGNCATPPRHCVHLSKGHTSSFSSKIGSKGGTLLDPPWVHDASWHHASGHLGSSLQLQTRCQHLLAPVIASDWWSTAMSVCCCWVRLQAGGRIWCCWDCCREWCLGSLLCRWWCSWGGPRACVF